MAQQQYYPNQSNTASTMLGVIFGAAAGMAVGMLVAPRSGRETRDQLKRQAQDMRRTAMEKSEQAKRKAREMKDTAQTKVTEVSSRTKAAVNAGKEAARNTPEQT
jgi:gas vesicle protein